MAPGVRRGVSASVRRMAASAGGRTLLRNGRYLEWHPLRYILANECFVWGVHKREFKSASGRPGIQIECRHYCMGLLKSP